MHFHANVLRSVYMSIQHFVICKQKILIIMNKLNPACGNLLMTLGQKVLREEKELIYWFRDIDDNYANLIKARGFGVNVEKENFLKFLDECFDAIYVEWKSYLYSKRENRWFDNF